MGDLGDEYRKRVYEYLNAEVERQNAEENIQNLKGTMNEMEEKMSDLKDQLNRVYVAIGDKNNLIDRGVMEKGGLLRSKDINENTDYSDSINIKKTHLPHWPLDRV